ncbi:MAG TPA: hypothetical protein DDZ88_19610 [Verrucomicrobiales bacterium]|nr:hypothetical protein [Verrucomicrobiales bacterium]
MAVHDFGEAKGGLLYIVMEYVEGTDVARMIAKEGRLHTDHAMAITAHVCDALQYAHERGIIHRDIKPANIMVGYDGVVKVADFGLAKMTHSNASGLTQSGMAMGTLHYMAPEALMLGSAVDHRADIYAVGVMLYQMLTGKIPQGMFKLPSLQIPGLDPRYDLIITKAIMEDREARYQNVGEMRRDLDGILTQPVAKVEPEVSQVPAALPTQARPQRPAGQSYRPPQLAVHAPMPKSSNGWLVWVMLGACALGGGYFWMTSKSPKPDSPTAIAEASPQALPPNPFEAVDPPDQPMPPASVAPVQSSTAIVPTPAPSPPAFDLQQLPDFRIRIANYQKARHAKLSALTARYRAALTDSQSSAPADAAAYTSALTQAAALMTEIEKNLTATEVKPLSVLAATTGPVPQRLKELRDIFGKETVKLETGLATDLDQSLSVVQASLTQAGTLDAASAVEAYRKQLSAVAFIMAGSRPANAVPVVALPTDLMNLAEWQRQGDAEWEIEDGAFVSRPSPQGHLHRTLGFDDFELTGEARTSAEGNGGIWVCAASMNLENPGGYEFQVCGSVASGGKSKTGSLLIGRALVSILDSEVPDNSWVAFRIRREGSTLQGWLDGRPTFSTTLLPESERALGRIIALQRWDKAGTVSYRGLKVTPLKKGVSVIPPSASQSAPASSSAPSALTTPQVSATAGPTVNLLQATKDKPFVNSLGMKFVPVPGTKVLMCIHETRRQDYTAYANEAPAVDGSWRNQQRFGIPCGDKDDHPVVNMNWYDSVAFCAWLGKKEGRTYRVPTDEEWSVAAGLGRKERFGKGITPEMLSEKEQTEFPWGGDFPPKPQDQAGNYADSAWHEKFPADPYIESFTDGFPTTAPVMSFKPNQLGLYDMGGNVWEWVEDWWNASQQHKVRRGGSYQMSIRTDLLSSCRHHHAPMARGTPHGFRVVLELP